MRLIAFAGAAQVEAPLTVDYQTVLEAINQLDTKTVERGGTDITAAIHSAELALGKSEGFYRALVLLTDGEDLEEDAVAAAKEAASYGIRIFTVGIGTRRVQLFRLTRIARNCFRIAMGKLFDPIWTKTD